MQFTEAFCSFSFFEVLGLGLLGGFEGVVGGWMVGVVRFGALGSRGGDVRWGGMVYWETYLIAGVLVGLGFCLDGVCCLEVLE